MSNPPTKQPQLTPEETFRRGLLTIGLRIAESIEGCQVALEAILAEVTSNDDTESETIDGDPVTDGLDLDPK